MYAIPGCLASSEDLLVLLFMHMHCESPAPQNNTMLLDWRRWR